MTFAHAESASAADVGTSIFCGPLPDATASGIGTLGTGPLGCIETGADRGASETGAGIGAEAGALDIADGAALAPCEAESTIDGAACERGGPLLVGVCGTVLFVVGRAPPPPPPPGDGAG